MRASRLTLRLLATARALVLIGLGTVALFTLARCQSARSDDTATASEVDAWPGPSRPRSYVTKPPPPIGEKLELSESEWQRRLTRDEFHVLRQEGTERAFTGDLWDEHGDGVYHCAGCGAPLFRSGDKFESGTGWPSFTRPIDEGRVETRSDRSFGMVRTEVHCARCGGHQGHIFDDGPAPTGKRYCINSVSLDFQSEERRRADRGAEAEDDG